MVSGEVLIEKIEKDGGSYIYSSDDVSMMMRVGIIITKKTMLTMIMD